MAAENWEWLSTRDSGQWEAFGTCLAAFAAVAGLGFAGFQLWRDRRVREEQAQPSVVLFMDVTPERGTQVDVVVRNFGQTPATDVRIIPDRPLTAAAQAVSATPRTVWLPESIPTLAPGQEWRTVWDYGVRRFKSGSAVRDDHEFEVQVSFQGMKGTQRRSTSSVLDWRQVFDPDADDGIHYSEVKSLNDVVRKLDEIASAVQKLKPPAPGAGRVI